MINQNCARSANFYGKLIKSKLQTFIISDNFLLLSDFHNFYYHYRRKVHSVSFKMKRVKVIFYNCLHLSVFLIFLTGTFVQNKIMYFNLILSHLIFEYIVNY